MPSSNLLYFTSLHYEEQAPGNIIVLVVESDMNRNWIDHVLGPCSCSVTD